MQGSRTPRPRILVHVLDAEQKLVDTRPFINPPKAASTILERLRASGFSGDLQDSEGNSLSSTDLLDETQEYRLLSPTGIVTLLKISSSVSYTLHFVAVYAKSTLQVLQAGICMLPAGSENTLFS